MTRRLRELVEIQSVEKHRQPAAGLSQTPPAAVRRDLVRSLRAQERAIARLTKQLRKLIASDESLSERYERLDSVPGMGETSAIQLLGELAVLGPDFSARQWVSFAGLDPREFDSGSSVHKKPRIIKAGNKPLRHSLSMPALVAVRHDPHLRGFYEHLQAQGKVKMQALVAAMRKLLHAIHGMFKSHQRYDGSKLFRLPSTSLPEAPHAPAA